MKIYVFIIFALSSISQNSLAMDSLREVPCLKTKTPCPFINVVLKNMARDELINDNAQVMSAEAFVHFSELSFGIDRALAETLAKGRSDNNGEINLSELLNPTKFPAHHGSLARIDATTKEEFACIDEERLDVLMSDNRFSTVFTINGEAKKYISYAQLKEYQTQHCWLNSDMSCISDWAPAKAESHLLWRLLSAYKIQDHDKTEFLPLDLIDNFLRNSLLPDDFHRNTVDPATRSSVAWAVLTD